MFPCHHWLSRARVSSLSRLHHHRHTTLHRTPLGELSARRRELYLTTNSITKRQTSVPPAVFEPTVPASEQPQTHTLDRLATGSGHGNHTKYKYKYNLWTNYRDLWEKYGEYVIIILSNPIMQGDNVVKTPVYLISVFSFVISKDMDKFWNYLDTCRLPSPLTVNDKSVLVDM